MTKLGTPIGAGPEAGDRRRRVGGGGGAAVGELEPPPVGASGCGWSPPPVALGKSIPPLPLPPPPPMPWLWVTPPPLPLAPLGLLPLIVAPTWTPPPLAASGAGSLAGLPAAGVGSGASLVSEGEVQSGSAMSMRPSPSSSTPFEQAGACTEGTAGTVVVGIAPCGGVASAGGGSAPAMPPPSAVTAPKLARAMVSASLCLIPKPIGARCHGSGDPCSLSPRATGSPTLLARMGACNGSRRPPTSP